MIDIDKEWKVFDSTKKSFPKEKKNEVSYCYELKIYLSKNNTQQAWKFILPTKWMATIIRVYYQYWHFYHHYEITTLKRKNF